MITLDMLSVHDLTQAEQTILAARQLFLLEASNFRAWGTSGGDELRQWFQDEHLERMDQTLAAIVLELESREITDEDEEDARQHALACAQPHLANPQFEVVIVRRSVA